MADAKIQHVIHNNRPAVAAGITGALAALLVSLVNWALASLPTLPVDVQSAIMGVVVPIVGGLGVVLGKIAQRRTWSEISHKAAMAYGLQLDPEHWREAIEYLGMTREEALEVIGIDPTEVP